MPNDSNSASRDGNKSRARQKQEIEQLRETVAQLEQQLTRQRVRRQSPKDSCGSQWREIAERERHQRCAALAENAKLREKAEQQLRITKKVKRFLHGRLPTETLAALSRRAIPETVTLGPSLLDNAIVVREMETRLPTLLSQCGAAFNDTAFQTSSLHVRHIEKRESVENGTQIVTAERRVCPFQRAAVSEAVLRAFGESQAMDFTVLEVDGDFASSDALLTIKAARFSGISRIKMMARRYEFDAQTLIVFTGMTDPTHAINSPCDGLLLQHSGWVRLRPLSDFDGATTYEAFHVAAPAAFDVVQDHERKAALLTNYMHATIGPQMDSGRDSVEGFLLARSSRCRN